MSTSHTVEAGQNSAPAEPLHSRGGAVTKVSLRVLLPIPIAVALAFAVHWFAAKDELPSETHLYTKFLSYALVAALVAVGVQIFWDWLRRWLHDTGPVVAAVFVLLCVWETITAGLRWLPMPYFPSPAGVLQNLVTDREMIWDSTWHSLLLLVQGYALGVATGLVTGICIGWFSFARYWGMPVLDRKSVV